MYARSEIESKIMLCCDVKLITKNDMIACVLAILYNMPYLSCMFKVNYKISLQ